MVPWSSPSFAAYHSFPLVRPRSRRRWPVVEAHERRQKQEQLDLELNCRPPSHRHTGAPAAPARAPSLAMDTRRSPPRSLSSPRTVRLSRMVQSNAGIRIYAVHWYWQLMKMCPAPRRRAGLLFSGSGAHSTPCPSVTFHSAFSVAPRGRATSTGLVTSMFCEALPTSLSSEEPPPPA